MNMYVIMMHGRCTETRRYVYEPCALEDPGNFNVARVWQEPAARA
jgi:hypothetical protein